MSYLYQALGLCIESDFPCPNVPASEGPPDVVVTAGPVPTSLPEATVKGPCFEAGEGRYLLEVDHLARFLIERGAHITVERSPGATDACISNVLLGSAMAALLQQRGVWPLRGSCILMHDAALIFYGISNTGKSTIAALAMQRGYPVLSDDLCAIVMDDQRAPMVYPSYPYLKLLPETMHLLELDPASYPEVRPGVAKRRVALNHRFHAEPVPLRHLILLKRGFTAHMEVDELHGMRKLRMIIGELKSARVLEATLSDQGILQLAPVLSNHLSVCLINFPTSGYHMSELLDTLEMRILP